MKQNRQSNLDNISDRLDFDTLKHRGWVRAAEFLSAETLTRAWSECAALEQRYYNLHNLRSHCVHLGDRSETRVSQAMMVTQGNSPLPHIDISGFEALSEMISIQNSLFSHLFDIDPTHSRTLLNWQSYRGSSTPVPLHFDGEYLRFKKLSEGEKFRVEEAVLPRFILLFIESNENTAAPHGVVLKNMTTGDLITPPSQAGDLLIFDNLRYFHYVPFLPKPRRIIGLRNFDLKASHYVRERQRGINGARYWPIAGGWVTSEIDPVEIQSKFLTEEWPKVWQQTLAEGAVG